MYTWHCCSPVPHRFQDDGHFLVRKTDVAFKPRFSVSVMNKGRIRHLLVNYENGTREWFVKSLRKGSIRELVNAHMESGRPVQSDGTVLVKYVPRPDFYILHEHVTVGKRLGEGNFGPH